MSIIRMFVCILCLTAAGATGASAREHYKDLYRQGVEQNKKGNLDEAIRLYNEAISLKPDSAALYFVRGRVYIEKEQYDNAIRDLGKAISLKPGYAEAYNMRGVAYAGKKKDAEATADFRKACSMGYSDACKNVK